MNRDVPIERLVVVGPGLIGGSFALALKRAGMVRTVIGAGRSRASLDAALRLGVIDAAAELAEAATGADFILVATPVGQMPAIFAAIAPLLDARAVITDGGSTKRDVIAAARTAFGARIGQFVPGHPIAGAEKSGPAAASAELYTGRKVILAPLDENPAPLVARVRAAWERCGARVYTMTPDEHDNVLAMISHLPHVLAYALVDQVCAHPRSDLLWQHAAGGFRDFTRIASSHPEMWRDICVANRDALLGAIGGFEGALAALRGLIERGDAEALEALFTNARSTRDRWLAEFEPARGPAPDAGQEA